LEDPDTGEPVDRLTKAFSAIRYPDNILSVNRIIKEQHYYCFFIFVWR